MGEIDFSECTSQSAEHLLWSGIVLKVGPAALVLQLCAIAEFAMGVAEPTRVWHGTQKQDWLSHELAWSLPCVAATCLHICPLATAVGEP